MTAEEAIKLLRDLEQSLDDYCGLNDEGKAAFRMAITALESQCIQPERKTGKWNRRKGMYEIGFKCSECNAFSIAETPYCSFCGARMVQEGEGHDE